MTGAEIAWRTLHMERVTEPCIVTGWCMKAEFYEAVTGRSLWEDREGVACEAFRRAGANLCPQLALPMDADHYQTGDWEVRYRATLRYTSPEQVLREIDALPAPETLERAFDFEAARDGYADYLRRHREMTGDDILWVSSFGQADFMGGYSRWGYENYLTCMASHPDHLRRYYEHSGERGRLQNEAISAAIRENGLAPFVYSGQDLCYNEGPICSPAWLREHYFPSLRRAVGPLIRDGIRIIWHCDGNILPVLDDLLDLGVSGFQGFQEEAGVPLEKMASLTTKWGKKPILWGSVSVTTTLPFGSVEDVKRSVERSFDVAGPGGGFCLAPTSSILPETPLENIAAFYEHGIAYGRRFLSQGF